MRDELKPLVSMYHCCWKRLLSIPKFVSVSIANRVHVREDSEATSCRKFLNLNLKLLKD